VGPLYRFGPLGPGIAGLPMASYATAPFPYSSCLSLIPPLPFSQERPQDFGLGGNAPLPPEAKEILKN